MEKYLTVNGRKVSFTDEKNLLEIIRKENIELPSFCYNSELSIYGSCRLCMLEIEGKGILFACSTPPESGMKIRTNNEHIIEMRKIIIELLLANHDRECTTCGKSETCQLQTLARRLGINKIRFKNVMHKEPKDVSTYSLVRESGKCILCGNCVRFCDEIQSVGAIGFANRGSKSVICPSLGCDLESSGCVYCGQCARVCPTGAIMPKSEISYVWKVLSDPKKKVVVAIAPAVRASIGEVFGFAGGNGTETAGKIVTALRSMGFAKVFDVSFAADMTIVEEADEFLNRLKKNKDMPLFTSCCPAWVKFVEQYYPDFISNLSSCRSPQAMYGSVAKKIMPEMLKISKEDLTVVSIMPCTAKKFEARRPELSKNGVADIDYVLTTQELARMIEEAGLLFGELEPSAFDMPLGFKTGGGVIFGNSGGVTEAVLRDIVSNNSGGAGKTEQFVFVRGEDGLREVKVNFGGRELNIAVVYGLKNARKILKDIKVDRSRYDFVEVMACPGGCIGGAGQPVYKDLSVRKTRTKVLYESDKTMELRRPQDNPYVQKVYKDYFNKPGSCAAHEYLHTVHKNRKRFNETFEIYKPDQKGNIKVSVCFGNSCMQRGSEEILKHIVSFVENGKYKGSVGIEVSMCLEKCFRGPVVKVANQTLEHCTPKAAEEAIQEELMKK
ncbi:NADH:ubiquinone oxidoreductase [Endomicrobiia bacterium]|nr:NADH:ubiquinone oxidoreductase [Endomicrobiia bacterium]GHT13781.1 NADH:ubiquinone oxidoreductase [Endomicrobiia bacterium]GHT19148.1 NADH:ubiquinone oxidoreductase [Endomicrobiia bacterium]GHT28412.1 NADH:ubiquinone oxidoreductase [Endomicrobiia bacterium]GHT30087.1 NADH:ubiquinone oxidoreductase [Endomicrobiia bacterium]